MDNKNTKPKTTNLAVTNTGAPPAGYRRMDTGAEGFWRGAVGDVLHGVLLGPAHDGLAGNPNDPDYPRTAVVYLLEDTIGSYKNEGSDEKSYRVYKAGETLYVNIWHRTREVLASSANFNKNFWMKVTGEKKISGGKTVKEIDVAVKDNPETAQASALPPAASAGALPS